MSDSHFEKPHNPEYSGHQPRLAEFGWNMLIDVTVWYRFNLDNI